MSKFANRNYCFDKIGRDEDGTVREEGKVCPIADCDMTSKGVNYPKPPDLGLGYSKTTNLVENNEQPPLLWQVNNI